MRSSLAGSKASRNDASDFERQLLLDEEACCALDARLYHSTRCAGAVVLPVVTIRSVTSLSPSYRHMLGVEGLTGRLDLIGGGVARLWSVAYAPPGEDRTGALASLITTAVQEAVRRDGHALAMSVSETDLPLFTQIDGVRAVVVAAPPHYLLETRGLTSVDEFVQQQVKDVRKVWRRDLRDAVRLRLALSVTPLSPLACATAAPAVADTLALNGGDGSRELAEWRLTGYLSRPGAQLLGVVSGGGESSFLGMTVMGDVLDVHTFGMLANASSRREHYQFMFRACTQLALDQGIAEVRFGLEHGWPKQSRGCIAVPRWRVLFSAQEVRA